MQRVKIVIMCAVEVNWLFKHFEFLGILSGSFFSDGGLQL
jgi:hypothetical protein